MPPRQVPVHIHHPQQDSDSIFYVHPSEGTNLVVIAVKLNGLNNLAWRRSMQSMVGANNKLAFVNG